MDMSKERAKRVSTLPKKLLPRLGVNDFQRGESLGFFRDADGRFRLGRWMLVNVAITVVVLGTLPWLALICG
jgi:hypothetical protein